MKKLLLAAMATMAILVFTFIPVAADAPTLEEWNYFGFSDNEGGQGTITMTINTATLKTTHFTIYNNTNDYVYFAILDSSDYPWVIDKDIVVAPYTTDELDANLNFQRLPATDPDDPDSIRMPKDTVFWCQYPTDNR